MSPLRTIASPVEAETLRVLAGAETDFSAAQIHRLAPSASLFGVRKALARLETTGLVQSWIHGNSTTWQGNRQHVLWPAIETAVNARRELLDRLAGLFSEKSELAAYLYGSFARHEAGPDSDVDVLVVYPDDTDEEAIVDFAHDVSAGIEVWSGNYGHVFNATRSWLLESAERSDPVIASVREDAVPVKGPAFEQFLKTLKSERATRG